MKRILMIPSRSLAVALLTLALLSVPEGSASAERLVQSTTEVRTAVHLKANPAAVQKLLPAGWVSNPGAGALKDVNVVVVLVEGVAGSDAEGKPVLHQDKYAVLGLPARHEETGTTAFMAVGGFISRPQSPTDAYGVYVPAQVTMAKSSRSEGAGATSVDETWDIATEAGDRLRFVVNYERGVGNRAHVVSRVHSGAKPEFYRIYKVDQVTEAVHSTAPDGRRAKKVEFSGSGPQLGQLLDGFEQVVAVTSIPAYYRQIFLPN